MYHGFVTHLQNIPHRVVLCAAKDMLVGMDDPVKSLFVVKSGLVNLVRFHENGGSVVLQRAGTGAILAEASVYFECYHCAAVAVERSELWAYPMEPVRALMRRTPDASVAFSRHMAAEVREARKRAEILALKTVAERLSAWLVWNNGNLPPKGARHHVADEIGVSREALYRELAKRT